jgi:hypothetical protein
LKIPYNPGFVQSVTDGVHSLVFRYSVPKPASEDNKSSKSCLWVILMVMKTRGSKSLLTAGDEMFLLARTYFVLFLLNTKCFAKPSS